jgi:hypothetical protein
MTAPKPMNLFFIDNQGMWSDEAQLVGDLVVWPDKGKYPSFTPVAIASAADFEGRIVMLAGNRGLVMAFCPGATGPRDVQKAMSGPNLEQYRIDLTALVQRMIIHRYQQTNQTDSVDGEAAVTARESEVSTTKLLTWLARSNRNDAALIASALRAWLKNPHAGDSGLISESGVKKNWEEMSELLEVLEAALAPKKADAPNG